MLHEKRPTRPTFLLLLILCAVVIPARAETQKVTTARVQKVLAAAVAKAEEIGVPMGIAVVDAGANLVGFIKMDGAFVHTHYTAQAKAYTAVSVRRPTHESGIPAAVSTEIASVTDGRFTTLPGGLPLVIGGQVIGAIGVGGGNGGQDIAVATAGVEALKGER